MGLVNSPAFWFGAAMGMAEAESEMYDTSKYKQYFVENSAFSTGEHIEHIIRGLKMIDKYLPEVIVKRGLATKEEYEQERAKMKWWDGLINMDLDSWDEHFPGWRRGGEPEPLRWFYTILGHAYAGIGLIYGDDLLFKDTRDEKGRVINCIHSELYRSYDVCDGKPYVSFHNFSDALASHVLSPSKTMIGGKKEVKCNYFSTFQRNKEYDINRLFLKSKEYKEKYESRYKATRTMEELTAVSKIETIDYYVNGFEKYNVPKEKWQPIYDIIVRLYKEESYANPTTKKQLDNMFGLWDDLNKQYKN